MEGVGSSGRLVGRIVCASRHPPRRLGGLDAQRLGGSAVTLFEKTTLRACWVPPERSKSGQGQPKSGPRAAKIIRRTPQEWPRSPQERLRGFKSILSTAKRVPRSARNAPRAARSAPKAAKRSPKGP